MTKSPYEKLYLSNNATATSCVQTEISLKCKMFVLADGISTTDLTFSDECYGEKVGDGRHM